MVARLLQTVFDDSQRELALSVEDVQPALLLGVLIAPLIGRIPARPRAAGGFAVSAAGICGAGVFSGSVEGLAVSMFVFMLGLMVIGPALAQETGIVAGPVHGVMATALYGFTLNIGGGVGAQVPLAFGTVLGTGLFMSSLLAACVALLIMTGSRRRAASRT